MTAPDDREACCEHSLWHHATRGCGYQGFSEARCPCLLTFDESLAEVLARVKREAAAEALRDAADDLGPLVDGQHPDTLNPDEWLNDRADRREVSDDNR